MRNKELSYSALRPGGCFRHLSVPFHGGKR